jgi:hypothetical protein
VSINLPQLNGTIYIKSFSQGITLLLIGGLLLYVSSCHGAHEKAAAPSAPVVAAPANVPLVLDTSVKDTSLLLAGECKCDWNQVTDVLQDFNVCLKVSEKKWNKLTHDEQSSFFYYCDKESFRVYPLSKCCMKMFLVEIKVNHGSGEYINKVFRYEDGKYRELQEFQAYIDTVIPNNNGRYYDVVARFGLAPFAYATVSGKFSSQGYYTDKVLAIDSSIVLSGNPAEYHADSIKVAQGFFERPIWN